MGRVYSKADTTVTDVHGVPVRLLPNEPWDADAEIVKQHPDAFSPFPLQVRSDGGWIETATAAPGEKRKSGR